MNLTTNHHSIAKTRGGTDFRTHVVCTDCQTLAADIHRVVSSRLNRPDRISADLLIDGVQLIELGEFASVKAALLSVTKLHRAISHN